MASCNQLLPKVKGAIKKSNNYDEYHFNIKDKSLFIPDFSLSFQLRNHLIQLVKLNDNEKELFINSFLTKKIIGIEEFKIHECICERFLFIEDFNDYNLSDKFFLKFKELEVSNHSLM